MLNGAASCLALLPCFPLETDAAADECGNYCNDGSWCREGLYKSDVLHKGEEQCEQKSADDALDQSFDDVVHVIHGYFLLFIFCKMDVVCFLITGIG